MKLVVTGGAGFVGSEFVRQTLGQRPGVSILNIDKLTYAGNLDNLKPVESNPQYRFVRADICDSATISGLFTEWSPDAVVHFAAESHVDRSILSPTAAIETNIRGTFSLLEAARAARTPRFLHVSTDEVYGSLEPPTEADEACPLNPSSPYSASKAGSDLLALSYFKTFGVPVMVTRASNNYGPYQFPEKLIPLMICNALDGQPLPVYGSGLQVRDWLHVSDHCSAIWSVLEKGRPGETFNIAGSAAVTNLEIVHRIITLTAADSSLIQHVADRPAHDVRYALTSEKLHRETGWAPLRQFDEGLRQTVEWYRANREWVERTRSGAYQDYYASNYQARLE